MEFIILYISIAESAKSFYWQKYFFKNDVNWWMGQADRFPTEDNGFDQAFVSILLRPQAAGNRGTGHPVRGFSDAGFGPVAGLQRSCSGQQPLRNVRCDLRMLGAAGRHGGACRDAAVHSA